MKRISCVQKVLKDEDIQRHVILRLLAFKVAQDQDSLLVKRRNDNHSPGPVIRE